MITTLGNLATTAGWAARRASDTDPRAVAAYIGGHGGRNLGDDIMVDIATRLFPQWRLVDYAESWHEKRLARLGLSGPGYFRHVLLGGGTLISPFWFGKVQTAVRQGVAISSLGTGAGSCGFVQGEEVDLSSWGPLLREFRHLGVRGPRSQRRLAAIGVTHAEVVGDLALCLAAEEPVVAADPPEVALNLSLPSEGEPSFGERERFAELAEAMRPLVKQGWRVRGYAMNAIDVEPTRAALEAAGEADVHVPHLASMEELVERIGSATLNVAVRLHGAILGCCVGVPPLMLGYRDKCLDFADSMDLTDLCVSLPEMMVGTLAERLEYAVSVAPARRAAVLRRAQAYKATLTDYAVRITREAVAAA